MFEAKLAEGHILKKIIEAIKDLVTDVNFEVTPSGKLFYSLQTHRNFTPGHGHFPRRTCFSEFEHGRI